MKKFIIAIAVLGIFIVYSLGIRHQLPVVGKPTSLATNKNPSSPPPNNANATSTSTGATGNSATVPTTNSASQYRDGTYMGSVADAYYGNVEVSASIAGGKLTAVKFLQYPDTHSTSVIINQQAMPYLQQEAIKAQSANVQVISGATFTSQAFMQSLSSALSKA